LSGGDFGPEGEASDVALELVGGVEGAVGWVRGLRMSSQWPR
jgi:hypothetical protein